MEYKRLLFKLIPFELLAHLCVAAFIAFKVWHDIPRTDLYVGLFAILAITMTRLLCVTFIRFYSSNGEPKQQQTYLLTLSNAAAGITWGLIAIALSHAAAPSITSSELIFATLTVTLATLAGSAFRTKPFMFFALPTLGLPLAYASWVNNTEQMLLLGFLLTITLFISRATQAHELISARQQQAVKDNSQLIEHFAVVRDEAIHRQYQAERASEAIKAAAEERRRAEQQIRASEKELSNILKNMQDTLFRTDQNHTIMRISPAIEFLLGYSPQDLVGQSMNTVFIDDDECQSFITALKKQFGVLQNHAARFRHRIGHEVWVSLNAHYHKDERGNVAGIDATARDETERLRAAEELFQEKDRLHVTLESICDGVITTDVNGAIEYINPTCEQMTGWSLAEGRGKPLQQVLTLFDEDNHDNVILPMDKWLVDGKRTALNNPAILRHNTTETESAIELSGAPIRDSQQEVIGAVMVFRDVTKLRNLAKQLSYQATHDALTGLINRIEFDTRVEAAIDQAQQDDKEHALLYLDLDQFKIVNDTCGHHAGDELLKQLTALLLDTLRKSDTLARLGGDEFGVLLPGCSLEVGAKIAEEQRRRVEEYRFISDGQAFRVGLSIGVVPITPETSSITDLLSAADSACYVAKERGRNCVHVSKPDDTAVAKQQGQMRWMQRIQNALDDDLFELYFQPIVPVKNPKDLHHHGELLIRMIEHTETGEQQLIPPSAFLPAAERYHLMPQIDRWVVRNALYALAQRMGTDHELELCAINLSGQSLGDMTLLDYVLDLIHETQVPPTCLCFEITESAVIANIDVAQSFIKKLKEMGCRFSLDDFGSGLSSFDYLKNLPVDYVKLDGGLVRDVADNHVSQAMVHAINYVTHVMGIKSIAEYVESEETLKALTKISVDYAQGVGIARPYFFTKAVAPPAKKLRSAS